jgi:predicted Abi (CAAX) family protease
MASDLVVAVWFTLWGTFIAFGLQVLYDGINEYLYERKSQKVWVGNIMGCSLVIGLCLSASYLGLLTQFWLLIIVFLLGAIIVGCSFGLRKSLKGRKRRKVA